MVYICIFFIVLLLSLNICGPIVDPDLWWHIAIGRWTLAHGFPHQDYWNLYSQGVFRAYSWLPEIIFTLIDRYFGISGLLILKLFWGLLIGFSLVYVFKKTSKDFFFGSIVALCTLASFLQHYTLRPQLIAWFCFVWALYLSDKVYKKGWNKRIYLQTIIIFSLWANSHLTTAIGLFVFTLWGFNGFNKNTYKLILIPFLGTLLTPYYGEEWITFFSKTNHPFLYSGIVEFKPAMIESYGVGFLVIFTFLFLMFLHFYSKELSRLKLLAIFTIFFGALTVVKFLPFATIILGFSICSLWSVDRGKKVFNFSISIDKFREYANYLNGVGTAFLLLCLIIVESRSFWKEKLDEEFTPVKAVSFIKDNKLKAPLLNGFTEGGYVIYSFVNEKGEPSLKVPVDGRTNVNSPKVMKKYLIANKGAENWQDYLKIVRPNTILWHNSSSFVRLMLTQKKWCRVFFENFKKTTNEDDIKNMNTKDSGFSVFAKRKDYKELCLN